MHLPKNCVQPHFLYVQAKLSMFGHLTNQSKMVIFGSVLLHCAVVITLENLASFPSYSCLVYMIL